MIPFANYEHPNVDARAFGYSWKELKNPKLMNIRNFRCWFGLSNATVRALEAIVAALANRPSWALQAA